jgi:hypothetical protein
MVCVCRWTLRVGDVRCSWSVHSLLLGPKVHKALPGTFVHANAGCAHSTKVEIAVETIEGVHGRIQSRIRAVVKRLLR